MPFTYFERLPIPSLPTYVTMSVGLFFCALYQAIQHVSQAALEMKQNVFCGDTSQHGVSSNSSNWNADDMSTSSFSIGLWIYTLIGYMFQDPFCIWAIINLAYCSLILMGRVIQSFVFGDLRFAEKQHIKDKFWNFLFYKFIFIFGIMNVQFMDELVLWCSWFSMMGFLQLLVQLCRDRWEYLTFSPTTPKWVHLRLLVLLIAIFVLSINLLVISICVGFQSGLHTFSFMAAECILVTIRSLYLILRYGIYLCDQDSIWENKATVTYYTEFGFELSALCIDFLHHFHMLLWADIFLSMASLVIVMQLRQLFYDIRHRLKKYKNYLFIVRHMETSYPIASLQELTRNSDNCAICWERMEIARKLPCCHMFHNGCLRSWLEQDTSCPTCRMTLTQTKKTSTATTRNHFFQFDGSRYASWLPVFSFEVLQTNQPHLVMTSPHFDMMARQIQSMFPNFSITAIQEDLTITQSMELTIENILEQRIIAPLKPEFILHTKIPSSNDSLITQIPSTELRPIIFPNKQTGYRFSKSPEEREGILLQRKLEMLELAKRKYLNRLQVVPSI